MGTKTNPAPHDCYATALPDEPHFTLLARDSQAPDLVDRWAQGRADLIAYGLKPSSDQSKVDEARTLSTEMRLWRKRNLAKKTPQINDVLIQLQKLRDSANHDDVDGSERAAKAYSEAIALVEALLPEKT